VARGLAAVAHRAMAGLTEGTHAMRIRVVLGVLLIVVGIVWIFQGVGTLHGSFMTDQAVWAVIGAIAVLFGIALLVGAARARGSS
jgi:hypothetical protein